MAAQHPLRRLGVPQAAVPAAPHVVGARTRRSAPTLCSATRKRTDYVEDHQAVRVLGTLAGAFVAVACNVGLASAAQQGNLPEAVYFGDGCFWGRQFDFIMTEKAVQKDPSAIVGYAGGSQVGPDGKVCYYLGDPRAVYEKLGHAEVVQVTLDGLDESAKESEFRQFARTYFRQFRRLDSGLMQRSDPQDVGAGYRNVVGLPGGTTSPLFKILQEENMNKMELRAGQGNQYREVEVNGQRVKVSTEGDELNVVWVVDSTALPFHPAEQYHQFHNGIGKLFPASYLFDLKNKFVTEGRIGPTGCLELPF